MKDIYQDTTNMLLNLMEKDKGIPWRKAWAGCFLPRNGQSGRLYQGINVPVLWSRALALGFQSNEWFTYNGAIRAGGHVAKGNKSRASAVYWKLINCKKEVPSERDVKHTFPLIKTYPLWNRDQCELPELEKLPTLSEYKLADDCVGQLAPDIREGEPAYVPEYDVIEMPMPDAFKSPDDYFGTMFHELAHWTGHKTRLDRGLDKFYGSKDGYAFEELVAELAACYVCAWFDIHGRSQAAQYLKSWVSAMKEDNKYIFKASRQGFEAARYILGYPQELDPVGV